MRLLVYEKENSEFKPVKLRLKNWPCVISCPSGGVGKYDNNYKVFHVFQSNTNHSISSAHSSSSSGHAISTDIPDPFSSLFSIVHCSRQVFRTTFRIGTELLYVGSIWSSSPCSSIQRFSREYINYEIILTFPTVSSTSGSSNLDSFRDGW